MIRCIMLSPPNEMSTFCGGRDPKETGIDIADLDYAVRGGLRAGRLCRGCVNKLVELLRAVSM